MVVLHDLCQARAKPILPFLWCLMNLEQQDVGSGTICHLALDNFPLSILVILLSRHVIKGSDTT